VGTFLNWCLVEKLCAENVAVGIPKPRLVEGEIGTLDWIQCRALLHAARGGPLLGYVVLGMFCGLRRAELERMNWDAVKLAEGVVVVAGVQAKTRQRRVVEIAPNAVAWLAQISKKAGKITPWDFKERFLELRKTAGLSMWPNNALRHTFASMHYAFHQNENLLQAQMGHENATMLHRHYRALKTRAEAEEFWGLKVEG
jgi:integrase